jgi:O-Antigen ligase
MPESEPSPLAQLAKQATTLVVALLVVILSLAAGGYSTGMRAAIACAAWGVVLGGICVGAFPRSTTPVTALIAGGMLLGLALLTGVSIAWASDDGAAIQATVLVAAYLGIFALILCAAREDDARGWLLGLGLGIVAVGLLAILSRLVPSLPGGDEEIAQLLPSARGRLSYPIGYWNATAALLALGVVLMTWLGASARRLAGRAAAVSTIPMLTLGIYLASSRGGFAAAALGIVVLITIGPRRPALVASAVIGAIGAGLAIALASGQADLLDATGADAESQGVELLGATVACMFFAGGIRLVFDDAAQRVRVSPLIARVTVGALVVAALVTAVVLNPGERFDEFKSVPANEGAGRTDFITSHLSSGSGSGRWQFWGVAVDAFEDEPVRGIGAGGYADYWNQHAPISRVTKQAHSLYIELLGDLGPLALIMVISFILVPAIAALRGDRRPPGGEVGVSLALVGTGALSAGIDWTFQVPVVFGVVVVAVALLAGPSLAGAVGRHRYAIWPSRTWRVAIAVTALVSLLLSGDQLLAQRSLDASQAAARDNNLSKAAEEARQAVALAPWAAEPRLQLALIQEAAGALVLADASVGEAIERSPQNWSLWLVRARIATRAGRLVDARAAFAEARHLNPRAPVFNSLSGPLRE